MPKSSPQCAAHEGPVPLVMMGHVISRFSQVSILYEKREEIKVVLAETVEIGDLLILFLMGWLSVPAARLLYHLYTLRTQRQGLHEPRKNGGLLGSGGSSFESSLIFPISKLVSQAARLACLVYFIDCVVIAFDVSSPDIDLRGAKISHKFSKMIYSTWAAACLMSFKRYLLSLVVSNKKKPKLGKLGVYDRILDILILFCLAVTMLGIWEIDVGPGLASIFAFGGIGTLVVSLACKDLAAQLVCGVVVSTSENFYVGDDVRLGTDTSGIIDHIGWLYTDVRGYDEIITRIPNEQIVNRRICNLSRISKCRVRTELRLKHTDIEKVTPLCIEIKEAIKRECPHLIADGTRPFRAHLREIFPDYLKIVVDARFNLPPIGSRHYDNRHKVLELICKVLQKNNITLACPRYRILQEGTNAIESEELYENGEENGYQ